MTYFQKGLKPLIGHKYIHPSSNFFLLNSIAFFFIFCIFLSTSALANCFSELSPCHLESERCYTPIPPCLVSPPCHRPCKRRRSPAPRAIPLGPPVPLFQWKVCEGAYIHAKSKCFFRKSIEFATDPLPLCLKIYADDVGHAALRPITP